MKQHKTNRIVGLIFICSMLVSLLSGFAIADVIWEPEDNFYRAHMEDCTYVNRDYYANGESGYLELFTQPGGKSLGFSENGKLFHVQFSYTLGNEVWGVVEYGSEGNRLVPRSDGDYESAWINLKDTKLKYDAVSFEEDHQAELTSYTGDYSELKDIQNIVIWTFPNSGEISGSFDQIDENFIIDSQYKDINGTLWGHVSYYYASKNFWICISKPTDTNIPAKDLPVIAFNSPSPDADPQPTGNDMTTAIIICVAAAILISAVQIYLSNKKKKKNEK